MEIKNETINTTEEVCTCYKCGNTYKKSEINIYHIHERNHTSYFASIDAEICLCDSCKQLIYQDWFNNELMLNDDMTYSNEEELIKFINTFSLEYQEKIFNASYLFPKEVQKTNREDWINEQIKIQKSISKNEQSKINEEDEEESMKQGYIEWGDINLELCNTY